MLPKQQGLSLMFQQKFKRCGWTNFSSLTSLWLGKGVTKLSNFWWLENALMQFGATSSSRWVIWMCGLLAANHLELPRSKKSALRTLIQFRWLQPIHAFMRVMRLPLLGSRTVGGCRWRFLCVSIWSWRFQRPCFLQSAGIWSSEGTAVFATKIDAGWSWSIVVTMLRTLRKSCFFCLSPKNVPSPWRTAWLCNLFCFNFFQSYKLWKTLQSSCQPYHVFNVPFIISEFSRMKEMDEDGDEVDGEDQERMEGQSDEEAEDEVLCEMVAAAACCEEDEEVEKIISKDENHEPTEMISEKADVEASTEIEMPETPRKDLKLSKLGLVNCFLKCFQIFEPEDPEFIEWFVPHPGKIWCWTSTRPSQQRQRATSRLWGCSGLLCGFCHTVWSKSFCSDPFTSRLQIWRKKLEGGVLCSGVRTFESWHHTSQKPGTRDCLCLVLEMVFEFGSRKETTFPSRCCWASRTSCQKTAGLRNVCGWPSKTLDLEGFFWLVVSRVNLTDCHDCEQSSQMFGETKLPCFDQKKMNS